MLDGTSLYSDLDSRYLKLGGDNADQTISINSQSVASINRISINRQSDDHQNLAYIEYLGSTNGLEIRQTSTVHPITIWTNNLKRLEIDSAGKIFANKGVSGASAHADYDEFVVEGTGHTGINILSPDANRAQLGLGSASDNIGGIVRWDYTGSTMYIGTAKAGAGLTFWTGNAATALAINSSGNFNFQAGDLTTTGDISGTNITATARMRTPFITFTNAASIIRNQAPAFSILEIRNDDEIHIVQAAGTYIFGTEFDAGALNLQTTGDFTDGVNAVSALECLNAYNHISATGASHSYINQDVTTGASPNFINVGGVNLVFTKLFVESGTAALPAITFQNPLDGDTGIWRSAADTLNISTGGVERFEIDATGADFQVPVTINQTADNKGIRIVGFDDEDDRYIEAFVQADSTVRLNANADWYFMRSGTSKIYFGATSMVFYNDFKPRYDGTKYCYGALGADGYLNFDGTDVQFVASAEHDFNFVNYKRLNFSGSINSATLTVTASADNTDVSGVNIMFVNITSNIVIGGLTGGVDGQVLHVVYKGNYTNTVTVEDTEGVGDQDIYTHTRLDETVDGGGYTLVCDGTNWYDCSHARHV